MQTYTRDQVIDIIALSFDATEIAKEIAIREAATLTAFGADTLELLRAALAVSKACDVLFDPPTADGP